MTERQILTRPDTIGYASGNLGKSMFWTSLEYLLLFYLTDLMGIPPAMAGLIIVVSLVWDGITDPLMGYWVDRRSADGHDYRPYLRWGPVLCPIAFALIFYVPFESVTAKTIYLAAVNILFRSVYTLLDVPHNALLARIPATQSERTNLSAWRYFFSSLGGLTVALAVAPLLTVRGEQGDHGAFVTFSLIGGAIACVTLWQSIPVARVVAEQHSPNGRSLTPVEFLRGVAGSTAACRFFAVAAINALTLPLFARMAPYLAKYFGGDAALAGTMFIAFTLAQISAMPLWSGFAANMSKYRKCCLAYAILLGTLVLGAVLPLQDAGVLIGLSALAGFAIGALNMLIWALAPDIVDDIERELGTRPDASFAAVAVNASYFLPFKGGSKGGDDYFPHIDDAVGASGASEHMGQTVSPVEIDLDERVNVIACFDGPVLFMADGQTCPDGYPESIAVGPRLLKAGVEQSYDAFGINYATKRHPRASLGVSGDGKTAWILVVDGRQPDYSVGASLHELTEIFLSLGASDAMNLDGGGSTTLAATIEGEGTLLNRPIHTGVPGRERPVANQIAVFAAPLPEEGN